jgi:salicylate hydroxylase
VLSALGLGEAVQRKGFEPTVQLKLNWDDGSLRSRKPMKQAYIDQYGAPYVTIHRAELHRLLCEALPEDAIHLGATCEEAFSRENTAVARFADGTEVEGDIIIAADGIRSTIRKQLFDAGAPRFTRSVAWRCMVDISCVPSHVGPDNSVALERGDHFAWYGPNGQIICYPIGDGSILNIFAGHVWDEWVEESWALQSSREELLEAYAGWNSKLLDILGNVEQCFKWGIFDRDPLPVWTNGRVGLLGDAAHPTMPNLAQGANMAIEDGYVLARHLSSESDPVKALQAYNVERFPRTSGITLQSRQNFENTLKIPPAPPLSRDWIYSFDATRGPTGA